MMDRELNAIADEGQVALWFGELIEEADERGIHVGTCPFLTSHT